jgi:hypothetical protein
MTERDQPDYTPHELELFARLATEIPTRAGAERDVLAAVRAIDTPRAASPTNRWRRWAGLAAAASVLLVLGGIAGARIESHRIARSSLEGMLARTDLSLADRVLLMQRAGSAYVQAAHAYAEAARGVDSLAVQVAASVLVGAAEAVASSDLDGGLSAPLAALLRRDTRRGPPATPVIWY